MKSIVFGTPVGKMFVCQNNGLITEVGLLGKNLKKLNPSTSPLLENAKRQIEEYFSGQRKEFDLPLNFSGTPFQRRVWQQLQEIPYGQTRSYKQIAQSLGSPNLARAVGGANNKNNFLIVVPCHRVIGASGSLVGYAEGLSVKEFLLNLEKNI